MKAREFATLCTVKRGDNGKPALKLFDRVGFDRALEQYGDGEEFDLTIAPIETAHSKKQQRFFHGPVLKAFIRLGYGKQEAKDMLALMFIPREIRLTDGSVAIVPGHTSLLSKEDYTQFIESCIQLAAEQGEVVEDSDVWRAEQEKRRRRTA